MIKSVGEAVFTSAPEVFDRNCSNIEVTEISDTKVVFKFANIDFTIENDGIIREKTINGERGVAKLEDMFVDAFNKALYCVDVSMMMENMKKERNPIDEIIKDVSINDSKIVLDKDEHTLPDDIII